MLLISKETDYAIDLRLGEEPAAKRIYRITLAEQKALQDFLEEALEKGWIRELTSLAKASILFVRKKNGSLRLYIDY